MIDPELVFKNDNVDSSSHMDWPNKTGEYLVLIEELNGTQHFTEVYFREDYNNFYFHTNCEPENTLEKHWHVEILGWIILREMSLNEFEDSKMGN